MARRAGTRRKRLRADQSERRSTRLDDWFAAKKPVKLGGEAPGANDSDIPRMLKAALKLPIQLIEGFKGTSNIRIAAEAGEVDGGCWTWASIRTTWANGLDSGHGQGDHSSQRTRRRTTFPTSPTPTTTPRLPRPSAADRGRHPRAVGDPARLCAAAGNAERPIRFCAMLSTRP